MPKLFRSAVFTNNHSWRMGVAKILHVDFWPQEKTWSPFTTYRLCILAVAGKVNPWVEPLMWNFALFTLHSAQFLSVSGTHFPPILAPNRFGRNCRCSFCQPRRKGFKDSSCRVGNLFGDSFPLSFGQVKACGLWKVHHPPHSRNCIFSILRFIKIVS